MALRYIADPEQAAKRNREGLRFLYGFQFPGDIPAIGKDCKAAVASQTASWLALGLKATAAETKSLLLNGILDRLFQLDNADGLPSKTQFAAVLADLKAQGLFKPAKALLNQIIELLAADAGCPCPKQTAQQQGWLRCVAPFCRVSAVDGGAAAAGFSQQAAAGRGGRAQTLAARPCQAH